MNQSSNLLARVFVDYRVPSARQLAMYTIGCVLFSIGAKFFIDAKLGTDPLDVLVIGMNSYLHRGMGFCSSLVAVVLLAWWTIWNRRIPPLTPFVTTAAVGYLIDLWNYLRVEQLTATLGASVLQVLAGLMICSYASSLIIMSGIGIRIMDLVAITMIEKLGYSFFRAKMTLEIGLFASGWALGGPVGIATVLFLFIVGPFIQPFIAFNARVLKFRNFGFASAAARA